MSRLKGYCPTCNGPLWRTHDSAEPAQSYTMPRGGTCRLCWLADLPTWCAYMDCRPYDEQDSDPGDPLMESWRELDIERASTFNNWRGWRWSRLGGVDEPDRLAEANSTEGTSAESHFVPLGCRGFTAACREPGDLARYGVWLKHAGATSEIGRPGYGNSSAWCASAPHGYRVAP